jgi:hypothetical protein
MSKKAFMDEMRTRREMMRDAINRGESVPVAMPAESNSFKAAPLLEWAKNAVVDENDPLLLRALEAQEKADSRKMTSWLDMKEAITDFIDARYEVKWFSESDSWNRLQKPCLSRTSI